MIETLKARGEIVAMLGGKDDTLALVAADVALASDAGTEPVSPSASVLLVRGDLASVARAVALARATAKNIRQNLGLAFGYNLVAIPIAAGVLYPVLGLLLSPMIAAAAMTASSLAVLANALRLRHARLDAGLAGTRVHG
jgi:P-type Cu+ transporter